MATNKTTKKTTKTQPPKKKKRRLDFWNKLAISILTLFLVGCISVFFILVNVINDPEGMRFSQDGLAAMASSRIYDNNGKMIYEFGAEIRDDITYDQIPQSVIDAFLSIEDSRYFDHNGFDLPRFIAAGIADLRSGGFAQGGSTLTMQMIDNAFTKNQEQKLLEEEGKISKIDQLKLKIQEVYLSLIAEQNLSKEDIFTYYVNRIWFGSGNSTRGIQKAAQYYFDKNIQDVTLEEAAFLAGSVNAPGHYNPLANLTDPDVDHLEAAVQRRNLTLKLMQQHGYITDDEYNLATNSKLSYRLVHNTDVIATEDPNQAYIDEVINETLRLTGQDPGVVPMDIYTALNTDVQKEADLICKGEIINFPNEAFDVGFAIVDNTNGEVIAIGPGRTYHTDSVKHDNATFARQPGSSMKPLLAYCSTFDILGWSTEHQVNDAKKDYWRSGTYLNNSDGKYNGRMSLAYALGVSKNTTAAAAMLDLIDAKGYNYWIDFCRKLGYDEEVAANFNEQYSIGGSDMFASPVQQANAYSIFANKGKRVDAHFVRNAIRRTDKKEFNTNPETVDVISEDAAFMMSYLLYKVVHGGYQNFNNYLASDYPVYGKSGTSDWGSDGLQYGIPAGAIKDEWSIGYTSQYTIACWSGYTTQYQQQGYYIPIGGVSAYTQAFSISHHMLDFCQQYGTYSEIEPTAGVSKYNGGYIKTEFVNSGDTTTTVQDDPSQKAYCQAIGGTWKSDSQTCIVPEKEEEEDTTNEKEAACTADGGTWNATYQRCDYAQEDTSQQEQQYYDQQQQQQQYYDQQQQQQQQYYDQQQQYQQQQQQQQQQYYNNQQQYYNQQQYTGKAQSKKGLFNLFSWL